MRTVWKRFNAVSMWGGGGMKSHDVKSRNSKMLMQGNKKFIQNYMQYNVQKNNILFKAGVWPSKNQKAQDVSPISINPSIHPTHPTSTFLRSYLRLLDLSSSPNSVAGNAGGLPFCSSWS